MRLRLFGFLLILSFGVILQSSTIPDSLTTHRNFGKVADYELEITLDGLDFKSSADQIFTRFGLNHFGLSKEVFAHALKGYLLLKQTNGLQNDRYLSIIDFSLSSLNKRLWVLDMVNKHVVLNELVAHGKNSGELFATSFSNNPESLQSSLGFYTTGETYNGAHKFSLKLNGIENGFNSNAFARGIVIHGASYVNDALVNAGQRIGRSFGCPAVDQNVNESLVSLIKEGSCLFIYANDKRYLQHSKLLNSAQYVPFDVLRKLQE